MTTIFGWHSAPSGRRSKRGSALGGLEILSVRIGDFAAKLRVDVFGAPCYLNGVIREKSVAEKSVFGIDNTALNNLNFDLAIKRIKSDVRSDFILAPHLSCIYADCAEELIQDVKKLAQSGEFTPSLPITIDVPKKHRIRPLGVKRLPPNYVRPGGILYPRDRLVLQAIADVAQPIIESKLNRDICFSHQPAPKESENRMFLSSRNCWNRMQTQLGKLTKGTSKVVLRADIASCFQSINQHTLINTLEGLGFPKEYVKPLESMLTQMSTGRSSRGILQGIYPSDLLGNFYLYPIDRHFSDAGIPSIRYVDDIYAFFESHEHCDKSIIHLYPELRRLDLALNEAKTCVTTPLGLLTSDPDLDAMFDAAIVEVKATYETGEPEEILTDYGFQSIWLEEDTTIDENLPDEEIELIATQLLFDQIPKYVDNVEEIERFCLPLFAEFGSDYAIEHVLAKLNNLPSMSQIYFSYLSQFLDYESVATEVCSSFVNRRLTFDWEYLWAIGTIIQMKNVNDTMVASLLKMCTENIDDSVKAMAFIAVAKHGDVDRQKTVADAIGKVHSNYLRAAILFSARYMHKAVRKNVIDLLENTDPMLSLIAKSVKKHS